MTIKYDMKLDYKDSRGNTALDMACIRGFGSPLDITETWSFQIGFQTDEKTLYTDFIENSNDLEQFDKRMKKLGDGATTFEVTRRCASVLKLLKAKKEDGTYIISLKKVKKYKGRNNPLHWAVHWRDLGLIELLYLENPELLLKENREGKTPFELIFSAFPEPEDCYDNQYSKYWIEDETKIDTEKKNLLRKKRNKFLGTSNLKSTIQDNSEVN